MKYLVNNSIGMSGAIMQFYLNHSKDERQQIVDKHKFNSFLSLQYGTIVWISHDAIRFGCQILLEELSSCDSWKHQGKAY